MRSKIISNTRKLIGKKIIYIDLIREIISKSSKMKAGVSSVMKEATGHSTVRKIREKKREEKKKGKPISLINKI
jgi:hypothetical protein